MHADFNVLRDSRSCPTARREAPAEAAVNPEETMVPINKYGRAASRCAMALGVAIVAVFGWAVVAGAGARFVVSQKGRAFNPNAIVVRAGDLINFVNDDGDLLHHAFLEDGAFSFDTGDQAPGSSTEVTFPVKGKFTVQCGIHPKMKLVVTVH